MVFTPSLEIIATTLLSFIILGTALSWLRKTRNRLPYPPGPTPKPIIGNLFDLPQRDLGQAYAEMGKKYDSDIVHLNIFGLHIAVVNKLDIVEELFDRRASIYSNRPLSTTIPLMTWADSLTPFLPYGHIWRLHRKFSQQNFRASVAKRHWPSLSKRNHFFLRGLLKDPQDYPYHLSVLTVSTILLITYGYEVSSLDDPLISLSAETIDLGFSLLPPQGTFINTIPLLRFVPAWVPGATGQKMIARVRELTKEMKAFPLDFIKRSMRDGTARDSVLLAMWAQNDETTPEDEKKAQIDFAWSMYAAATDTTKATTGIITYLFCKYPDVRKKAQEEVDRVVGNDRLPALEDRDSMPYIEAIYLELMRHYPVTPVAPHSSVEDDTINGYFLPKGTFVLANIWGICHDEERFPNASVFMPERFLDEAGNIREDMRRVFAYGFGRRICAGKNIASDMLWLFIASFAASFNITPAKDNNGDPIPLNDEFSTAGGVLHKIPFKCDITPRSNQIRALIEDTANEE